MKSSQNSETMPSAAKPPRLSSSKSHDTVSFNKFGVTFTLNIVRDKRFAWKPHVRLPDGTAVDTSVEGWASRIPMGVKPAAEWVETDEELVTSYVQHVTVQDDEFCVAPKPLQVYTTADGPILGVQLEVDTDAIMLLDPCVVRYDDKRGGLQLVPIFNVARHLRIMKAGIRTICPPAELLVGIYPGFMIQNRQAKYTLKPNIPVTETIVTEGTGVAVTS
jgi:hypothetical protein